MSRFAIAIAIAIAAGWSGARAEPCPAAVTLRGEAPGLVDALSRRGIRTPPAPGCAAPVARIMAADGGLRVAQGEGAPAAVPDVETAALLIETWVRADLIDPLLAARRGPPPPTARPITLDVALDGAWTDDRGSWLGARVEGCIALSWICPGVRLRGLYDPGWSGESATSRVWRVGIGALATADVLFGDSRAGLGVGVDVVRTDGLQGADDITGAPLFELKVGHAFPLAARWAVEVSVAGDLALWPRRARGAADLEAEGLPGLPRFMVLGGLGVRWRAP